MQVSDIKFLYAYERWATQLVLAQLDGIDPGTWARTNVFDERGLGGILVHHFGAASRWRIGFESHGEADGPEPEKEPLPTPAELRELWAAEWVATDAWLAALNDDFLGQSFEGVPVWQLVVHVINHGTQHRSEAAALLTAEGRSPRDLDVVEFAFLDVGSASS